MTTATVAPTTTRTQKRLACPYPTREDLTQRQYIEHSEGVRMLTHYGFMHAGNLSLDDMRDAIQGVSRCSFMRARHIVKTA